MQGINPPHENLCTIIATAMGLLEEYFETPCERCNVCQYARTAAKDPEVLIAWSNYARAASLLEQYTEDTIGVLFDWLSKEEETFLYGKELF